jgi:hypothetical protein
LVASVWRDPTPAGWEYGGTVHERGSLMKRTTIWAFAAFVGTAAALVAPMTASAALPAPHKARIVPFKSMGVVGLGTTRAKAFSKWGETNLCSVGTGGRETCDWLSSAPTDFPEQGGVLELKDGKVCGMLIRAGTNATSGDLTITSLKKWKTDEGVGLGSTLKAAKHVLGGKLIAHKHHVTTAFDGGTTPSSDKQVEEITIFKDGCNVT